MGTRFEVKVTRSTFFKANKTAKSKHWIEFDHNSNLKDLWAIHPLSKHKEGYTLPSFLNVTLASDRNKAFISYIFPPLNSPPVPKLVLLADAQEISIEEISRVVMKCSNKSTPGRDQIPDGTWKAIHCINPKVISYLLSPLLHRGHHSTSRNAANGIILSKPAKASYTK
jgi:hypothetical protein